MGRVRKALRVVLVVLALAALHYTLPQHDIARINSTEVIRMDFSSLSRFFHAQSDSGSADNPTRDVRLINAERRKSFLFGFVRREAEGIMVYRNEDTGWTWPPYFKFDSSDLQAEASASISPPGEEKWVVIAHYGWRNRLFSIYPNAVAIRPADGPDEPVFPWFNVFFLAFLAFGYFLARATWRLVRDRWIDPLVGDAVARVGEEASRRAGRLGRWFGGGRSPR